MSYTIKYQINFHSDWHCSSGQSAGFGVDLLVIRDHRGLPFIPGKTLKGLLRDAADSIQELDAANSDSWQQFKKNIFGQGGAEEGGYATKCFFANAELPAEIKDSIADENKPFLFLEVSSTAINDNGIAKGHSLRVMETVIPLKLEAAIHNFPDAAASNSDNLRRLTQCVQWIKRLGVNRNRGFGRCTWQLQEDKQPGGNII